MAGLRILLLNWRDSANPLAGGAEVHIQEVFARLASKDWEVTAICAAHHGLPGRATIGGIEVFRCGGPYAYYFALPITYRRVAKLFRPHLVIDFMNKLPLFAPLYAREPVICFVHHLFGSAASLDSGRAAGLVVSSFERFVRPVYANTPCLAGSNSTISELESVGLPRENLFPVSYGVDVNFYSPGTKSEDPSILYVGRLKTYKGLHDLVQVVANFRRDFPNLRLKIAGQGGMESELRTLTAGMGLEHCVELLGYVSEEKKRSLYREAWVTCFPSRKEGFGLTIPEAALCGTPTVGYDVPGLHDAIQHDETGLLVQFGDTSALARALGQILSDSRLRERLAQKACQTYATFSWDRAAEQTRDTILSIVQSRWPRVLE